MQCKDIPDRPILEFLARVGTPCTWRDYPGVTNSVKDAMPADVPTKLILAKMRQLQHRGMIEGCCCGCYGGFEITKKGCEWLAKQKEGATI